MQSEDLSTENLNFIEVAVLSDSATLVIFGRLSGVGEGSGFEVAEGDGEAEGLGVGLGDGLGLGEGDGLGEGLGVGSSGPLGGSCGGGCWFWVWAPATWPF